jgi:hypothetical protein
LPELDVLAEGLNNIGDDWRAFALQAVRMIKGRDAVNFAALSDALLALSDKEGEFFRALRKAVA